IGTLVERTTRYTLLLHLPRMAGHGSDLRVKNGPPLAGHGAEAVRDAIASTIITLPAQLRRSLTGDQGVEMTQHARLRMDTGVVVFFCDPHPRRLGETPVGASPPSGAHVLMRSRIVLTAGLLRSHSGYAPDQQLICL